MHNALSVLLSIFLISSPLASSSAFVIPPGASLPSPRRSNNNAHDLTDNKCTFTLFHKQLATPQTNNIKTNYIQINALTDNANSLTIDIAHLRPTTAFNTYSKISSTQVFAIEGLLDGRNLTVRGDDGSDVVRFESGGVAWTSEVVASKGGEAWCQVGEWVDGSVGSRERKMECGFPCEAIEMDEEEQERVELR